MPADNDVNDHVDSDAPIVDGIGFEDGGMVVFSHAVFSGMDSLIDRFDDDPHGEISLADGADPEALTYMVAGAQAGALVATLAKRTGQVLRERHREFVVTDDLLSDRLIDDAQQLMTWPPNVAPRAVELAHAIVVNHVHSDGFDEVATDVHELGDANAASDVLPVGLAMCCALIAQAHVG